MGHGYQAVPHRCALDVFDTGDNEPHLSGHQRAGLGSAGRKHTDHIGLMLLTGGFDDEFVAFAKHALGHPDQGDNTEVIVEPGINNEGLQWRLPITFRRRDVGNEVFQGILDTQPGLGADRTGIGGIDTDDLFNFQLDLVRISLGQIHFIE